MHNFKLKQEAGNASVERIIGELRVIKEAIIGDEEAGIAAEPEVTVREPDTFKLIENDLDDAGNLTQREEYVSLDQVEAMLARLREERRAADHELENWLRILQLVEAT